MRRRQDVIVWVIDRLMAHEPRIRPELALTVEREARAEWGGRRIDYIAKTCAVDLEERRQHQRRIGLPSLK